jgi:hypothetical protein
VVFLSVTRSDVIADPDPETTTRSDNDDEYESASA